MELPLIAHPSDALSASPGKCEALLPVVSVLKQGQFSDKCVKGSSHSKAKAKRKEGG